MKNKSKHIVAILLATLLTITANNLLKAQPIVKQKSDTLHSGYVPFVANFGYCSSQIPLHLKNNLQFNEKLLGSWITNDSKCIYVFCLNKNAELYIRRYYYFEERKSYSELRYDTYLLYGAKVGDSYFLERSTATYIDAEKKFSSLYFPIFYEFNGNNELLINGFSDTFTKRGKRFSSAEEYRNYVNQSQSNNSFFGGTLHLYRFNNEFQVAKSNVQSTQDKEIAAAFLIGIIADLIFGGSGNSQNISQPNTEMQSLRPVGYDYRGEPLYKDGTNVVYDAYGNKKSW